MVEKEVFFFRSVTVKVVGSFTCSLGSSGIFFFVEPFIIQVEPEHLLLAYMT